ncbi:MAG: hypothetical protein ACRDSN_14925 [Pseudonocardiaceae bacterium]
MALDTTSPADEEETLSQAAGSTAPDAPQLAEVDLLIERPDLGPGCSTLIVAGDPIPPNLARLPSAPYRPSVMLTKAGRRRT